MSETETLIAATADVATETHAPATQKKQIQIPKAPKSEVAVDIGFKSEGMIPRSEFSNTPNLQVGDEVEVLLEAIEDKEGRLQLSRKRADFIRVWERINEAAKTGEVMSVKVVRRIKGGLVVDLMGIEAFMPGSQIDTKPVRDFDVYLNQTMDVRV